MQRPEQALQIAVVQYLALAMPDAVVFAIPNAGKRSRVDGGMQRRAGLRAGMPDLCVIQAGKVAFIELKAPKGSVTAHQAIMLGELERAGAYTAVCRSVTDVWIFLNFRGFKVADNVRITEP